MGKKTEDSIVAASNIGRVDRKLDKKINMINVDQYAKGKDVKVTSFTRSYLLLFHN